MWGFVQHRFLYLLSLLHSVEYHHPHRSLIGTRRSCWYGPFYSARMIEPLLLCYFFRCASSRWIPFAPSTHPARPVPWKILREAKGLTGLKAMHALLHFCSLIVLLFRLLNAAYRVFFFGGVAATSGPANVKAPTPTLPTRLQHCSVSQSHIHNKKLVERRHGLTPCSEPGLC